jgi:hypothetical protein
MMRIRYTVSDDCPLKLRLAESGIVEKKGKIGEELLRVLNFSTAPLT